MLDPMILRRYRSERAKGTPAVAAMAIARHAARSPRYPFLTGLDLDQTVAGNVGPFAVRVQVQPDEDARLGDDDVTGVFTDTYTPGCIRNTVAPDWHINGQGYRWYRPAKETLSHAYDNHRRAGMSRGAARAAYAAQVVQEMNQDAQRRYVGVVVTVGVAGHRLADESLWWIDCPPDYDNSVYLTEVAEELIDTALDAAHKAIPAVARQVESELAELRSAQKGVALT